MAFQQKETSSRKPAPGPPLEPQHPLEPAPPRYPPDPMVKLSGEGPVHILSTRSAEGKEVFLLTWAPYNSPDALPARRFEGENALCTFLQKELNVDEHEVQRVAKDLATFGRASIPMVPLQPGKAKRLGLTPPNAEESS